MQTSVTFRHMETSEALKQYAIDKLDKIRKFFPDPIRAQIVLSMERYLHKADIAITLHNGLAIKGKETTEDMYAAIDLVMDKIERQVRRYKERINSHRPSAGPEVLVHYEVMQPVEPEEGAPPRRPGEAPLPIPVATGELSVATADRGAFKIVKSTRFFAKPMSVDEAIMQLNLLSNDFLVFTNADTRDVNVVYRRPDGNYGLIETGRSAD